jgi:hypothetical protein
MKRTDTQTLIDAMRKLDIQSDDGVAQSAIREAADRLEELQTALIETQGMASEAILKPSKRTKWLREIEARLIEALQ